MDDDLRKDETEGTTRADDWRLMAAAAEAFALLHPGPLPPALAESIKLARSMASRTAAQVAEDPMPDRAAEFRALAAKVVYARRERVAWRWNRRRGPVLRRTMPRRAPRALRRHRRAARTLQKASGDDSGPEPPPPLKTVLLVSCAAEALGFAAGLLAAVVLP